MDLFPAFLALKDRHCIVAGSTPQALNRAARLIEAGARVTLLCPDAPPKTARSIKNLHAFHQRRFEDHDLDGCWLAIAACREDTENERLASACATRQIFCNVPTREIKAGSAVLPSVVDRSPLLIAITTAGVAPALARALKNRLESLVPTSYAQLARTLGNYTEHVSNRITHRARRAEFWHALINGRLGQLSFHHDHNLSENILKSSLDEFTQTGGLQSHGFVSLIGAGPGDPDLLTFKALRLIQSADTIVYDRLVSPGILNLCRSDAEFIYAGKAKADHALPQQSINELLVELAKSGKHVVRLKGGDPFIFGRGGEEMETLAEQQINFQVVPGITAASGCAAYSGIPLTHRDHAQSCVFVTGHLQNGEANLNWQSLCDPTQTIVVYMGLTALAPISRALIAHGRAADTPAALVEQGTTPDHRVHTGTLENLPELVRQHRVNAPTLLIIGSVVTLHEKLEWYDAYSAAGA